MQKMQKQISTVKIWDRLKPIPKYVIGNTSINKTNGDMEMTESILYNVVSEMTDKERLELLDVYIFYDMMCSNHKTEEFGRHIDTIIKACRYCRSYYCKHDDFDDTMLAAMFSCGIIGRDINNGNYDYDVHGLSFEEYAVLSKLISSDIFKTISQLHDIAYKKQSNVNNKLLEAITAMSGGKKESKADNEVWMNYTVGDQVRYAKTGQFGFIKEVNEVSQTYIAVFDGVEYSVTEDELN